MTRAEVERWVEHVDTPTGPRQVIHVVHHHAEPPARRSTWAQLPDTGKVLAVGALVLGVFMFISLFALAGDGGGGSALLVGLLLGVLATGFAVAWMAAKWG